MTTTVLTVSADSGMGTYQPNTPGGGGNAFRVGYYWHENPEYREYARGLLRFDGLSDNTIPFNAVVSSAILKTYVQQTQITPDTEFNVYRLLKSWVESEATFNVRSTGNSWTTPGGFNSADCEQTDISSRMATNLDSGYVSWILDTDAVEEIISGVVDNNGFLIKSTIEDSYSWRYQNYWSKEAGTTLSPLLEITYTYEFAIATCTGRSYASEPNIVVPFNILSTKPVVYNIDNCYQGARWKKILRAFDKDRNARDFTGYTAKMQIRDDIGGQVFVELTTENGGIVISGNQINLKMTAAQTALLNFKEGVYDLFMTGGTIKNFIIGGSFKVQQRVTK